MPVNVPIFIADKERTQLSVLNRKLLQNYFIYPPNFKTNQSNSVDTNSNENSLN